MSRQHNDGSCDKPRAPKPDMPDTDGMYKLIIPAKKDALPLTLYGKTYEEIQRQYLEIKGPVLNNTMVSG